MSMSGRQPQFASVDDVAERLEAVGYLSDPAIALTVFLADRLEKPVLVEGPAGVGKTELAKSVATATGSRLIRLQCYEGLDETKALYEWNYKKQLLRIQADEGREAWSELEMDIFSEPFLLARPLLSAIRANEPVVLLIDEIDRVEVEAGGVDARGPVGLPGDDPGARLDRGDPPPGRVLDFERHARPVRGPQAALPLSPHRLSGRRARAGDHPQPRPRGVRAARRPGRQGRRADPDLDLKKAPSISESIDWARTLVLLGLEAMQAAGATDTLHVLLKYETDIAKARAELRGEPATSPRSTPVDRFRQSEEQAT